MSALAKPCMASMQEPHHSPHQIKFDMDSQKFLIDSGVRAHLLNHHKDFISYRALSPRERKNDQVLGEWEGGGSTRHWICLTQDRE